MFLPKIINKNLPMVVDPYPTHLVSYLAVVGRDCFFFLTQMYTKNYKFDI